MRLKEILNNIITKTKLDETYNFLSEEFKSPMTKDQWFEYINANHEMFELTIKMINIIPENLWDEQEAAGLALVKDLIKLESDNKIWN